MASREHAEDAKGRGRLQRGEHGVQEAESGEQKGWGFWPSLTTAALPNTDYLKTTFY